MAISSSATGLRPGVCTSTTRPTAPYTGQIIFQTDTGTMHNWDGTTWQFLAPTQQRNLLYNGAMQVAQRGTSTASITSAGYYTADRWYIDRSVGTWTQSVENDAPTGSGFRKSLKMLLTSAGTTPTGVQLVNVQQRLEGQDLQSICKGTASAQKLTLSFYVKTNVTGTYIVYLFDVANGRQVGASYSVSSSGSWEYKTVVFAADTSGVLANDNTDALELRFWLVAGPDLTSGTLRTSWTTNVNADVAAGQTANVASATNNYWQITGVQLNVGSYASPFEFKSYQRELQECQRYFQTMSGLTTAATYSSGVGYGVWRFPATMRATPSIAAGSITTGNCYYLNSGGSFVAVTTVIAFGGATNQSMYVIVNHGQALNAAVLVNLDVNVPCSAEL